MKKTILYLLGCYLLCTCNTKQDKESPVPKSVTVSVLLDITDPKTYWPTANQMLALFNCDKFPTASFHFRLSSISNLIQNERIIVDLPPPERKTFSVDFVEEENRSKSILRFYDGVRNGVKDFYKRNDTSKSLERSICAQTILNELQYLAEQKADTSTLVVCSDVREYDELNTYGMDTITSSSIAKWLESINPTLPSLAGITVMFIFMPKNPEEDKAFNAIANGYKAFLVSKGATITIQANL